MHVCICVLSNTLSVVNCQLLGTVPGDFFFLLFFKLLFNFYFLFYSWPNPNATQLCRPRAIERHMERARESGGGREREL